MSSLVPLYILFTLAKKDFTLSSMFFCRENPCLRFLTVLGVRGPFEGQRSLWESKEGNEPETWEVGGPGKGGQYICARSTYIYNFAASLRKFVDPKLINSYQSIKLTAIFYKRLYFVMCVLQKLVLLLLWRENVSIVNESEKFWA